jgi:hypothetical protein
MTGEQNAIPHAKYLGREPAMFQSINSVKSFSNILRNVKQIRGYGFSN